MKNSVLAGFHAVGARLRTAPETISVVYADPSRRDKRMRDMREKLLAALDLPEGYSPLSALAIGYTDEELKLSDAPRHTLSLNEVD